LPAGCPAERTAGVKRTARSTCSLKPKRLSTQPRARFSAAPSCRGSDRRPDYEHFLALHWSRFHASRSNAHGPDLSPMDANAALLPPRLLEILPRMRETDWLGSYRSIDSTALALDRIGVRLSRENLLRGSGADLVADYAGFEADFFAFIGDAQRFAQRWRRER